MSEYLERRNSVIAFNMWDDEPNHPLLNNNFNVPPYMNNALINAVANKY